jgi:hypothetical protein
MALVRLRQASKLGPVIPLEVRPRIQGGARDTPSRWEPPGAAGRCLSWVSTRSSLRSGLPAGRSRGYKIPAEGIIRTRERPYDLVLIGEVEPEPPASHGVPR